MLTKRSYMFAVIVWIFKWTKRKLQEMQPILIFHLVFCTNVGYFCLWNTNIYIAIGTDVSFFSIDMF